jgi:uncharacterized protein YwgA
MILKIRESINTEIKDNLNDMEGQISPEGWILAFFYAGPDKGARKPQINGFLMFTKQFFVFVKEIKKDLDPIFKFIPYDYGPYSFVLKNLIDKLIADGYIDVKSSDERKDYTLTDKGFEKGKKIFDSIDEKTEKNLENLRREATQLGYSGVLRYVYSRYPEYTTASKIRGKVMHEY